MEIVKLRIKEQIVNISVPKSTSLEDSRKRTKTINKYKRILNKLIKSK